MDTHATWNTKAEITYLKKIGRWDREHPRNRQKCLEGYLTGSKLREHWNDINREEVIDFATELLRHEQ